MKSKNWSDGRAAYCTNLESWRSCKGTGDSNSSHSACGLGLLIKKKTWRRNNIGSKSGPALAECWQRLRLDHKIQSKEANEDFVFGY